MKNFTLVTALALGGLAMNAQVVSPTSAALDFTGGMMKHIERVNDRDSEAKGPRKAPAARAAMPMREIAGPGTDDQVIDQTPEGEMKIFQKSGFYYAYNWLYGMLSGSLDGNVSRVVTSPDGSKMYIQNPVTYCYDSEENWIVGEVNGDEVTFTFPQLISHTVYDYEDGEIEEYFDYALKLEFIEDDEEEGGWYYPTEDQNYTFRILPDGSLEPTEPNMMIGQCSWFDNEDGGYWSWQATGDIITSMKEVNDVPIEVPAAVEMETWSLVSGISTRDVKIGVDGDKMYFAGSFSRLPEAAVVGTIEGDKVTFENSQYLGISWYYSSLVYFLTGHMEEQQDEDGSSYSQFVIDDSMTFDYDAEKKILSCPDGAFLLSSLPDRVYYYSYVDAPYICVPDPDAKVTRLLNPVISWFYDYDEEWDYYPEIIFNFPVVDADKQPLDKSKLYYQVIVDGEPYEFYDDEYELPEGDTMITDVPFGFNSYDFYASGIEHDVVIYTIGFDTLGVRTLYKDNDETLYSDIVWVDEYSKVNETLSAKDTTAVRYYDLLGNAVSRPIKGIFIRQTTYTDGSVKAEKVVKK